jgi:hypothetical protein
LCQLTNFAVRAADVDFGWWAKAADLIAHSAARHISIIPNRPNENPLPWHSRRCAIKSAYREGRSFVSVPQTAAAVPDGSFYSVAFETNLSSTSYPGLSRAAHFQEANEALLQAMNGDSGFAQSMQDMGVSLERTPTGLAPRQPPAGWTWHHAEEPGLMQLVPRAQHTPVSIFWDTLHPNGQGGYAIWGN